MNDVPGFSAEVSLYRSGRQYRGSISCSQAETGLAEMAVLTDMDLTGNEIIAAWPWDCPTVREISWDDFNRTEQVCDCYRYWTTRTECGIYCDSSGNCEEYCDSYPYEECDWSRPQCWTRRVSLPDGDIIDVIIEYNVVDPGGVHFVLELVGNVTWKKVINLPDGQGSSWDIVAEGSGARALDSLHAHQVHNGQSLTFSKAKFFGKMCPVYTYKLEGWRLPPRSRITFRWVYDG